MPNAELEMKPLARLFAADWNEAATTEEKNQACRQLVIWLAMSESDAERRTLQRAALHAFPNRFLPEED